MTMFPQITGLNASTRILYGIAKLNQYHQAILQSLTKRKAPPITEQFKVRLDRILPQYTQDDVRSHVTEEPCTARIQLSGKGLERFNERGCAVSQSDWMREVEYAHSSTRRRQWLVDCPNIPDKTLITFMLQQSAEIRASLDNLKIQAKRAVEYDRASADSFDDIVNLDDDGPNIPSWLTTGLVNGRTKVGKVIVKRGISQFIAREVEALALISRQVKFIKAHPIVVVATSEPNAFMQLGTIGKVDTNACFGTSGCNKQCPIILGESKNSVVYYCKRADDRSTILCRAWGKLGNKGLFWTNLYSHDDTVGNESTYNILITMVGYLLSQNTEAKAYRAYISDDTGEMYDNSDGVKIGTVRSLHCTSSTFTGQSCCECNENVGEDYTRSSLLRGMCKRELGIPRQCGGLCCP